MTVKEIWHWEVCGEYLVIASSCKGYIWKFLYGLKGIVLEILEVNKASTKDLKSQSDILGFDGFNISEAFYCFFSLYSSVLKIECAYIEYVYIKMKLYYGILQP